MSIRIRIAEERDLGFLVEMNRIVHELHVAAAPAVFKAHEAGAVAEMFRARLGREDVHMWIAQVGDVPVGYAVVVDHVQAESALCFARRFYVLDEIGVSPAHRRQGVARALIERVLVDAQTHGIRDVQLSTWSFNGDAQAAFQALGFRPMTVRFQRPSG
jgi:ribosomal protein S18 acetylase RimI-like enzyme